METLLTGNSFDRLKELPDNSVGALVTDPPYLINFLGNDWDKENSPAADKDFWSLCLAKLKPGAHGLVFGHSRQHHRVMVALEDAGFEIRDVMMWMYGQGFPKNHNIGNGYGTALKPAYEPIILVRKPLERKLTIKKNFEKHGVGALNIEASKIAAVDKNKFPVGDYTTDTTVGKIRPTTRTADPTPDKRYPANIILDEVAGDILNEQAPQVGSLFKATRKKDTTGGTGHSWTNAGKKTGQDNGLHDGLGGAARFFYCAKISSKERNWGMGKGKNTHPTVKPISLMNYLVRLVAPEGETVLDPFMGSGSTGMACVLNGNNFIGIDLDEEFVETSKNRITYVKNNKEKINGLF